MAKQPPQTRRRGFTLVELTMVVLVMGILAAAAAPKFTTALASSRAQAAARRIAADLRLAREYAMKSSVAQTVDFNVANETYTLPSMADVDRPNLTYTVNLAVGTYPVDINSANFEGVAQVQFDIYGRANRTGSVVVRSSGQQRTVQVDKIGNISIL